MTLSLDPPRLAGIHERRERQAVVSLFCDHREWRRLFPGSTPLHSVFACPAGVDDGQPWSPLTQEARAIRCGPGQVRPPALPPTSPQQVTAARPEGLRRFTPRPLKMSAHIQGTGWGELWWSMRYPIQNHPRIPKSLFAVTMDKPKIFNRGWPLWPLDSRWIIRNRRNGADWGDIG